MTLKQNFMALVIGSITLVAQATIAFDSQLELATNYDNQAIQYYQQGQFQQALPLAEKAFKIKTEVLGEKHAETLTSMNNLAEIYRELGSFSDALPLFEKGYRLSQRVLGSKHLLTLGFINNLAGIYRELGSFSEALPLSKKGYRLSQQMFGEQHQNTLLSLNNVAMIYKELGRLSDALPLFEKNYRLSQQVLGEQHPHTFGSLGNLALIYYELSRFSEALPLFEKDYRLSKKLLGEQHLDTIKNLNNLALIYAEQGNTNKAIKHFEKFLISVEHLRSGDFSIENRQSLFKKWVSGYFNLSRLYLEQYRSPEAFRLAEMSKARTLLESIAAKLAAQQTELSKAEQQKRQQYEDRLASLNNRIAKALEGNRIDERIRLETKKNQIVRQLNQFQQKLMAKYPKYAQLSEVQIVEAQEGAKYLPMDAVFISYLVNEEKSNNSRVLAFTLQSDGTLTAHDSGKIPNLQEKIADYRRRLSLQKKARGRVKIFGKPEKDVLALSRELGKLLLEPLKKVIQDKPRWIISPSSSLALIPFETLRLAGENSQVIAQHHVTYVQSLSVLKLLQERDKAYQDIPKRGTLLAMGAPIYEEETFPNSPLSKAEISRRASRASTPSAANIQIARRLVRSGDYEHAFRQLNLQQWQNLPGTLIELEQLKKLFFFKTHRLRLYKQAEATEAKLQQLNQYGILAKYRYLVFSAHGYLSTNIPVLSSIVLGQVNNPPGIDGYVTAGEWTGYNLKSDLMVLSACDTGVGTVVGGEGVMGLPYAFYVAGNKNTLLTLWEISDKVTAEFVVSFFRKLKKGVGQIEALTATKREFFKKYGEAYWAAFVLYGV